MQPPDYWLSRPDTALTAGIQAAGGNPLIDGALPTPKWQFLCYLAEQHGVVLHGTGDPNIQRFEPRPSHDLTEFGATACGPCSSPAWTARATA